MGVTGVRWRKFENNEGINCCVAKVIKRLKMPKIKVFYILIIYKDTKHFNNQTITVNYFGNFN